MSFIFILYQGCCNIISLLECLFCCLCIHTDFYCVRLIFATGLSLAKEELARLNLKDKGTRPKVLFLITDGSQSLGEKVVDLATVAEEIRSLGVRIVVIGIGANVKARELETIAGDPNNVYLMSHFPQLLSDGSLQKFSGIGCKAGMCCAMTFTVLRLELI